MARIADSSFLYAAFDAGDRRHQQARDEIAKPQALGVPLPVLSEFLDLLVFRHGRAAASQAYEDLMKLAVVNVQRIEDEDRVVDVWHANPAISMADAAGVVAAVEQKARLLSYDMRQMRLLASIRAPGRDA